MNKRELEHCSPLGRAGYGPASTAWTRPTPAPGVVPRAVISPPPAGDPTKPQAPPGLGALSPAPAMPAPGRPARPRGGASPARARRRAEAAGGAAASFSSSSSSSPAAASRAGGGPRHGALLALYGRRRQGRGGDARPGECGPAASPRHGPAR